MKMNKFWIVVVLLFLGINSAALGFLWFRTFNLKKTEIHGPVNEFLAKELKLSPSQVKQYDTMRIQHHELTRKLNDENHLLRDSFFSQIKLPALDTVKAKTMAQKISNNQQLIETATLYHFHQFRSILNPAQQTRFDELIIDVLHSMGGPEQRAPGPDGRGRPDGPGQGEGPPSPGPDGHGLPPRP
jgi:Spy/CpxP family protein refolding chaperone